MQFSFFNIHLKFNQKIFFVKYMKFYYYQIKNHY